MVTESVMPALRDRIASGAFVVTAEITPPRGPDTGRLLREAGELAQAVDAINVTDGAGANVRMSSIAAAAILKRAGYEPIAQATCRDRNRIALQSDLIGAAALGIDNVLVLTGDSVAAGDHPDATPVFDLDSRALLKALAALRDEGVTLSGKPVSPRPPFLLGAADVCLDPDSPDWSAEPLLAKVRAGAGFVQSQYCFDAERMRRHVGRLRDAGLPAAVPYLVGLGPLRSARVARWMADTLWGTVMPAELLRRMEQAADPEETGIDICAELLAAAAAIPGIDGAHLMAPGHQAGIVEAVRRSGAAQAAAESSTRA
jgi:methylenetetrahydrofolate reductase (NADPH)